MDSSGETETDEEKTNNHERIPKTVTDTAHVSDDCAEVNISKLREEIKRLTKEIEEWKFSRREYDEFREEFDRLTKENEEWKFSKWEYDNVRVEVDDLKKQIKEAKEEYASLQEENVELVDTCRALRQQLRSSTDQSSETEALREKK